MRGDKKDFFIFFGLECYFFGFIRDFFGLSFGLIKNFLWCVDEVRLAKTVENTGLFDKTTPHNKRYKNLSFWLF